MIENMELVVTKKTVGTLVTNIDKIEAFVTEKLKEYTPELYRGDADAAKKDRAELNTGKKTLTQTRIAVIKELMKPYEYFETRCKALEKNIDAASSALDKIVKVKEDAEKDLKRKNIELYFSGLGFDLVPLVHLFDDKWLNKTVKLADAKKELDAKIKKVYEDIKILDAYGVDLETLKPLYLETLNLGQAIEHGNRLKENRERLAKEEETRKEREALEKKQEAVKAVEEEIRQEEKAEPSLTLAQEALGVEVDPDPVMSYTLRFTARKSVLLQMRKYMAENGIDYEKLEG